MVMAVKGTVFEVVMPCSLGRAQRWRQCVPQKCWGVSGLHSISTQKTTFFMLMHVQH
jgi:hypothetical protein